MSAAEAVKFADSPNCFVCGTQFTLFNRKHHCRNCGQTLCGNCSTKSVAIPRLGYTQPVRVCDKCFGDIEKQQSRLEKAQAQAQAQAAQAQQTQATANTNSPVSKPVVAQTPVPAEPKKRVTNCTCNSPLCICPPDPEPVQEVKQEAKQSKPVVPRPSNAENRPAPASADTPTFTSFQNSLVNEYDLNGDLNEQCREAIKSGDFDGVKKLVSAGANVNYADRTGNTLLHLAAMFNRLDMAELLISKGADLSKKNPSSESPVDVAPPALAAKLKAMRP